MLLHLLFLGNNLHLHLILIFLFYEQFTIKKYHLDTFSQSLTDNLSTLKKILSILILKCIQSIHKVLYIAKFVLIKVFTI